MNRKSVRSSNILSIGYDSLTRTLEVEFRCDSTSHSGRIYHYLDVPPEIHRDLMSAESKGKFMHRNVMWAFRYQRLQ
jgi:hypothetical protein